MIIIIKLKLLSKAVLDELFLSKIALIVRKMTFSLTIYLKEEEIKNFI